MSLKGILDVEIKNDEQLDIYLKYDPNLISAKEMTQIELKLNI